MKKNFLTPKAIQITQNIEKKRTELYNDLDIGLKQLWKRYHLTTGKEKSVLHKYIDALETKMRALEEKEKKVSIINNDDIGEILSNAQQGYESFFVLLKEKKITLKEESFILPIKLYSQNTTIGHYDLLTNIIKEHSEKSNASLTQLHIKNIVKTIMRSKNYFAGRYNSSDKIAYIWDFPNKELVEMLNDYYIDLEQIHY
jgi:hypothetical protein